MHLHCNLWWILSSCYCLLLADYVWLQHLSGVIYVFWCVPHSFHSLLQQWPQITGWGNLWHFRPLFCIWSFNSTRMSRSFLTQGVISKIPTALEGSKVSWISLLLLTQFPHTRDMFHCNCPLHTDIYNKRAPDDSGLLIFFSAFFLKPLHWLYLITFWPRGQQFYVTLLPSRKMLTAVWSFWCRVHFTLVLCMTVLA